MTTDNFIDNFWNSQSKVLRRFKENNVPTFGTLTELQYQHENQQLIPESTNFKYPTNSDVKDTAS